MDLTLCTAQELLSMYRSGATSPVEVTHAVLARIARLNPSLLAYCLVDEAQAMACARNSEMRWQAHRQRGEPVGALEGIPVSVKDLILTKGWPTLRGSRAVSPDQVWDIDAPAVARMREAGAVLLGKTTTPEFGCKGETNSPLTGFTRNPWRLDRTPGGSSGGAAAAVAAGLGPLAIGTDGAGSVRIPAAFCGNVGMKPSFGRVPAYPLSPFGSVAHLGPHAMTVSDAALMLQVLKQPDARDWTALPPDPSDYTLGLHNGVRGLRVAYSATLGYARQIDPDIAAAVEGVARTLQDLGAVVEAVDPGFEDPLEITTGLWFAGAWQVWRALSPAQQEVADPDFRAQALMGEKLDASAIHALTQRRGLLGSHMRQFMTRYDLLLTPSVAIPAFEVRPPGSVDMTDRAMLGWTPFSYPFNLTQQPAITVPCGLTRDGLPMGMQLVGPMFGDALVLRAARAYESTRPTLRPTLGA
ncbi:MAG: Acylamidase [Pseudomonadota bacterium]|jgi:aspartyl-tRNA(Asn)/glutamyl-tRNA(Gln) amidotransferase subunit A